MPLLPPPVATTRSCCATENSQPINYHPQSGWFEDTPLKGGTEEGCPLKGAHEGTFLIEAGQPAWNTPAPLVSPSYCAWGLCVVRQAGLRHKTSFPAAHRRNGRAFSSLTAGGGGLPVGVK